MANPDIERMVREIHAALFNRVPSQSMYRDVRNPDGSEPQGNLWQLHELIKNDDGMAHQLLVENMARYGDPDAIWRIARVASGRGAITDKWAVDHARAVLESLPPEVLAAYQAQQGGQQ